MRGARGGQGGQGGSGRALLRYMWCMPPPAPHAYFSSALTHAHRVLHMAHALIGVVGHEVAPGGRVRQPLPQAVCRRDAVGVGHRSPGTELAAAAVGGGSWGFQRRASRASTGPACSVRRGERGLGCCKRPGCPGQGQGCAVGACGRSGMQDAAGNVPPVNHPPRWAEQEANAESGATPARAGPPGRPPDACRKRGIGTGLHVGEQGPTACGRLAGTWRPPRRTPKPPAQRRSRTLPVTPPSPRCSEAAGWARATGRSILARPRRPRRLRRMVAAGASEGRPWHGDRAHWRAGGAWR